VGNVLVDLKTDGAELDDVLSGLDAQTWTTPTPAAGWTITHQVAHLAATFKLAGLAASKPDVFRTVAAGLSPDFDANVRAAMAGYLADPPHVLLQRWREDLAGSIKALAAVPDGETVPWLVRPLPAPVLAMAGMMELFGHGQDILDTLNVQKVWTDRVGHLVAFGVRTWDFGYLARDLPVPDVALRFELKAPSGTVWTFGPEDAEERVTGPAVDFCLLVARRRNHEDLALDASGPIANQWLDIAQAYRGPAGPGRRPGQFTTQEPRPSTGNLYDSVA
jgi:enediyne biosynthesis protein E11